MKISKTLAFYSAKKLFTKSGEKISQSGNNSLLTLAAPV